MNLKKPVLLIAGVFFLIKLFFLSRYHLPIWDEAVYLGMGKYIYSMGTSGLWEMIRPIGFPLFIGWTWKIGLDYVKSAEVLSLLFALGCIYLTYLIGKNIFNEKIALLSSLLLALTPVFFLYSSYILTEIPSTFFVLLAIYLFLENKYMLSGVCCAFAFMFKFPQGLILASLLLVIFIEFIRNRKFTLLAIKSSKIVAPFLAAISPFLIFNYFMYRAYTSRLYHSIFRPLILGAWHQANPSESVIVPGKILTYVYNYLYYLVTPIVQNPLLIFAFFGVFYYFRKKLYKKNKVTALFILFLVPFLYFTYIPNKQFRFLIQFLPLVCLLASLGFYTFYDGLSKRKAYALKVLTIAILISLLIVNISFFFWRPASEPSVVVGLYRFISNNNIKGPVLTADPVFCVYSDNHIIPYYFMLDENIIVYNEWERSLKPEALVFTSSSFYCAENDAACISKRDKLLNNILSNNTLVFNQTFYSNNQYYIFRSKGT